MSPCERSFLVQRPHLRPCPVPTSPPRLLIHNLPLEINILKKELISISPLEKNERGNRQLSENYLETEIVWKIHLEEKGLWGKGKKRKEKKRKENKGKK